VADHAPTGRDGAIRTGPWNAGNDSLDPS